jgi:hypothetical protein
LSGFSKKPFYYYNFAYHLMAWRLAFNIYWIRKVPLEGKLNYKQTQKSVFSIFFCDQICIEQRADLIILSFRICKFSPKDWFHSKRKNSNFASFLKKNIPPSSDVEYSKNLNNQSEKKEEFLLLCFWGKCSCCCK